MWKNYLKIAFRNLLRYRGSNFINIFGLALGLACCICCYLHIEYELGYDRFHEHEGQIVRLVVGDMSTGGGGWVKVSAPIPPLLKSDLPEIEKYSRFSSVSYSPKVVVAVGEKTFSESYFMMADPDFFSIFSFPMIKGQRKDALKDLNSVVLSESTARKLFGTEDPIGKVITLQDNHLDFQVTAVAKDVPEQSHLVFDYLISFENLDRIHGEGRSLAWGEFNYFNYFLLSKNADLRLVEDKIHKISIPLSDGSRKALDNLSLQPLRDIHFQYNRGNILPSYDRKNIYIFSVVAFTLLLIACINYINLSIALSIRRVKEIGVRKTIGAGKFQLTLQFMSESFCTMAIAVALSLLLLEIMLPVLNPLLDSHIVTHYTDPVFTGYLLLTGLVIAVISGSYLAFYANSGKTSSILKGAPRSHPGRFSLQNGLVFTQFSIALILIISSLVISDQLTFMQDANIGMDYHQVVNVPMYSKPDPATVQSLKEALKKNPAVQDVAASSFLPGKANWHQTVWWEGQLEPSSMYILSVDKDFFRTMDILLTEGNAAEISAGAASGDQYILNESAVKVTGWTHGLGKQFSPFGEQKKKPVAGVVKDFNFKSLHYALDPLVVVVSDKGSHDQLSLRVSASNTPATMEWVQQEFKKWLPDVPFEFEFLDQKFKQMYVSEIRLGHVVSGLTILAVLFSLMGLYALISFNIENKTKEIAIRKALGISLGNLMVLFSKGYFKLALAGAVAAIPATYYLIGSWLNNFNYKVHLNPLLFAAALGLVFVALAGLILLKSFSFGRINPAEALKYE